MDREKRIPVITVDGLSGTGKGTLCQRLARRLEWHLLDSGALYRALAHAALQDGVDLDDEAALAKCASRLRVRFREPRSGSDSIEVIRDGTDVTEAIRSELCGGTASRIAALPGVRAALLSRQRAFRQRPGLVADGRDMGTVVFPDAELKIFLTASQEERARRRYKQLKEKGISVSLSELKAAIQERDTRDSQRRASPLTPALDAAVIDTTKMRAATVEQRVMGLVQRWLGNFFKNRGQ